MHPIIYEEWVAARKVLSEIRNLSGNPIYQSAYAARAYLMFRGIEYGIGLMVGRYWDAALEGAKRIARKGMKIARRSINHDLNGILIEKEEDAKCL